MKTVYLVSHGDKHTGANPGMTEAGFFQIKVLKKLISAKPTLVICGTGKRHENVREALGFTDLPTMWTPAVGGPESLEKIQGFEMVVFADGTTISLKNFPIGKDRAAAMLAILEDAPNNTVICAGQPAMVSLGVKDAKSAALYRVDVYYPCSVENIELDALEIKLLSTTVIMETG